MSQATDQAARNLLPESPAEDGFKQQEPDLSQSRAALAREQEKAIASLKKSIKAAGLVDDLGLDVRCALEQALEAKLAVLEKIDLAKITDAKALLAARNKIESR